MPPHRRQKCAASLGWMPTTSMSSCVAELVGAEGLGEADETSGPRRRRRRRKRRLGQYCCRSSGVDRVVEVPSKSYYSQVELLRVRQSLQTACSLRVPAVDGAHGGIHAIALARGAAASTSRRNPELGAVIINGSTRWTLSPHSARGTENGLVCLGDPLGALSIYGRDPLARTGRPLLHPRLSTGTVD